MARAIAPAGVDVPTSSAPGFVPDARVLLFPVRREELLPGHPAAESSDAMDAADFRPRWWPGPAPDGE